MRKHKQRPLRTPSALFAAWPCWHTQPNESMLQYLWGSAYSRHYAVAIMDELLAGEPEQVRKDAEREGVNARG